MKFKSSFVHLISYFLISFFLISCASNSSSSSSSTQTTTTSPSRLIDLTIEGVTSPVMIALNTNKEYNSASQTAGVTPKLTENIVNLKSTGHKRISLHDSLLSKPQGPVTRVSTPKLAVTDSTTSTTFITYNFDTPASPTTIATNRVYNGTYCYIFVKTSDQSEINQADINTLGNLFDTKIYSRAKSYFTSFYDVDNNNKMIILIYDLNIAGTAGYFWSGDFFQTDTIYTNKADMIYLNASFFKNLANLTGAFHTQSFNEIADTVAHETQHLLNFSARFNSSNNSYINNPFETWIEEGIAEGVVPFLTDNSLSNNFNFLNSSETRNGLGLIYWNNSVSDYALSFSFFEYLRIQCNLTYTFYKNLMDSYTVGSNYLVVENVFENASTNPFTSFDDAVLSYKIANYYNLSTGKYGYKGQYTPPQLSSPSSSTLSLQAGGSGYFTTNLSNFVPTNVGDNIYYYRINYSP